MATVLEEFDSEMAKLHDARTAVVAASSATLTPEQVAEYVTSLSSLVIQMVEAKQLRSVKRVAMARALIAHFSTPN